MIITIISSDYDYALKGPPSQEDAQKWANQYPKSEYVLYDAELKWVDLAAKDLWLNGRRDPSMVGFPFYYYVHTSNMMVWDTWAGFPDGVLSKFQPWMDQELELLDYISQQPLAISPWPRTQATRAMG
ncbi:MAG: hypothetical protein GY854_28545 [Deltaproteobacteria bacterium]|nr:hypothetical protein [Deltaproteobacteria bacterium]